MYAAVVYMGGKVALEKEIDVYAKHLEQKIEERSKELLLLQRINSALNSEDGVDEILQMIVDGMRSTFGYRTSVVFLLSDDKEHLIMENFATDPRRQKMIEKATGLKATKFKIPLFEGSLFRKLIETKELWETDDSVVYWEQWTDKAHLKPLAKIVAKIDGRRERILIPLSAKEKVVGVIGIVKEKKFTEEDKKRLIAFGEQAGLAVHRAKLYQDWIKEDEIKEYLEKAKEIVTYG